MRSDWRKEWHKTAYIRTTNALHCLWSWSCSVVSGFIFILFTSRNVMCFINFVWRSLFQPCFCSRPPIPYLQGIPFHPLGGWDPQLAARSENSLWSSRAIWGKTGVFFTLVTIITFPWIIWISQLSVQNCMQSTYNYFKMCIQIWPSSNSALRIKAFSNSTAPSAINTLSLNNRPNTTNYINFTALMTLCIIQKCYKSATCKCKSYHVQ